jgi:Leucine-rich repeat (LRR) protein
MKTLSPTECRNREALRRIELCRQAKAPTLNLLNIETEQVPAELGAFTWLTSLDLSHNRLTEVPEFIGNLAGLTRLDLSYNKSPDGLKAITALPESLGNLNKLTHLKLRHLSLKSLPGSFKSVVL